MKIALGTLKDNGEELVAFLEPRVGTKPSLSGDSVEIQDEGVRKGVKPRHVKTYVKRFLHTKGVRRNYRVFVSGRELTIQEIELGKKDEEEEKEESKREAAPANETPEKEVSREPKAEKQKALKKPRAKKKAAPES